MPVNNFNIGKDVTLQITTQKGQLVLSITTGFEFTPKYKEIESHGLDGVNRNADLPAGGSGKFMLDRADSVVDDFFCQQEADYFNGVNLTTGSIQEVIQETNGSVSTYRFEGVTFRLEDGGKYKGDDKVPVVVGFKYTRRKKVS
jgi:hypothetical protein